MIGVMGSAGSGDGERGARQTAGMARMMRLRAGLKVRSSHLLQALIYLSDISPIEISSLNTDIGPCGLRLQSLSAVVKCSEVEPLASFCPAEFPG